MKKYLQTKVLVIVALSLATLLPQDMAMASALNMVQGYGLDTVAGFHGTLRTSQTWPYQDVIFTLLKPDGQNAIIPAKTGGNGIARVDLSDYHTHKAGKYSVSVQLESGKGISGEPTNFLVYPDKFSAEKSKIETDKAMAKSDGHDEVLFVVRALDQYENKLKGHSMQVVSSRSEDKITSFAQDTLLTDENGKISFKVSSSQPGLSTYSVVNITTGQILAKRANIVWLDQPAFLSDIGGDARSWLEVAHAASSVAATSRPQTTLFAAAVPLLSTDIIHHFEITGLPAKIQPNQSVNFTVVAKAENSQTVQSYGGKVHFSAEGSNSANVTLPEDYTFRAEDLGTHQFSLGLSFKAFGNYKIVATDLANVLVKGIKDVTVGNIAGTSDTQAAQPSANQKPTIESPIAGTFTQKTQTVSGKAPAGVTVKIFDNQIEIGSFQTDTEGKYTYQASLLAEGEHNLYVATVDASQNIKAVSNTIKFSIDTTPPKADQIELDPNTPVKPSSSIKIKVYSEEKLSQAALVFNSDIVQLIASIDRPGIYTATLSAPATAGVYPVDVILVDQLGNEGSYKAKAQITVENGNADADSAASSQTRSQTEQAAAGKAPTKVSGVIAYASDKRITLVWDAAAAAANIKHYRIYYGLDTNNLDRYADTKDSSTTWYVPNLENGKSYYFAVTAFDTGETESAAKSDTVTGTPFSSEASSFLNPGLTFGAGDGALHGAQYGKAIPPRAAESGPEVLWLIGGSGIIAEIIRRKRRH